MEMSAAAANQSKNLEQLLLVIRRRWRMLLLCVVLVTRVDFGQSLILVATIALALVNWAIVARRSAAG